MYCMVMPEENAQVFVDHIFKVFDKDHNGVLDFQVVKILRNVWTTRQIGVGGKVVKYGNNVARKFFEDLEYGRYFLARHYQD